MTGRFGNLREDVRRYHFSPAPQHPVHALRNIWTLPGFQAVAVYRLGRWLRECRRRPAGWPLVVLTPLFWLLQGFVRCAYDIHLDQGADLGAGLYIGHFGGIYLASCRLGRHCAIQQEVRIHPAEGDAGNGPEIGDRVWIGAHATIVGQHRIAGESTIGAGSVVVGDVAARCLMLGSPARVARWDYDNSEFL